MAQSPPYHVPIYMIPDNVPGQVAQAESPSSGSAVDTGYIKPPGVKSQQWNIDPSVLDKNEFFVKLNSDSSLVLEAPENEADSAFINTQGDRNVNGGIQVWVFEPISANQWRLKNFKTERYLYLNYDGRGESGAPGIQIVTRTDPTSGLSHNADWKITDVVEK